MLLFVYVCLCVGLWLIDFVWVVLSVVLFVFSCFCVFWCLCVSSSLLMFMYCLFDCFVCCFRYFIVCVHVFCLGCVR